MTTQFLNALKLIENRAREKKVGLSTFILLGHLEQGNKNLTELGRLLNVSSSAMTGLKDSCINKGLVALVIVEDDRRKCMLTITDEGFKLIKDLWLEEEPKTPQPVYRPDFTYDPGYSVHDGNGHM